MKKTVITLAILLSCGILNAQAKKDSIPQQPSKNYFLILPDYFWSEIVRVIKLADEKPSVVNKLTEIIMSNLRVAEPPKIDSTKKKK